MLAALTILAVGAGSWWWSARESEPANDAAISEPRHAPPPVVPKAPPSIEETHPQLVQMPPASGPLRDSVAALQSRAEAGDSLAACRLGMSLLRCAALGTYQPGEDALMAEQEYEAAAKGDLITANKIATGRLLHAELRNACSGVPEALVAQANRYVRQAALAGQPEAMIRYALGESLAPVYSFRYIATPEFDAWRREARPILMRALESGQPEAALALASAHTGNAAQLGMLLPQDGVEAGASIELARRLFGDDPALTRALFGDIAENTATDPTLALDSKQVAAAEQMARDWHDRNFQGSRLVLADSTSALLPLHRRYDWAFGDSGWPGTSRPVPCEALPGVAP
jgi:hypothetical protein